MRNIEHKIKLLEQQLKDYEQKLLNINQQCDQINTIISNNVVVDKSTYGQNKLLTKHLIFFQKQSIYFHAKYLKSKYDLYKFNLIKNSKRRKFDAEQIYNYIQYIDKNKEEKIFPYKLISLSILKHYFRYLQIKINKLNYLKGIVLRKKLLTNQSTWLINNRISSLEKNIKEKKDTIENLKQLFADKYYANLVRHLEKSKKDFSRKESNKKWKSYKQSLKNKYKSDIAQCIKDRKQIDRDYKIKLKQFAKDNNYKHNKSILQDKYLEEKFNIKNRIKLIKNNYWDSHIMDDNKNIIELRNVVKYYNNKVLATKALYDINLTIEKGEFIIILGQSGSGKTTLLNIISGMDNATYGDVIVAGQNIIDYNAKQLTLFRRKNIGYVFQQYGLLPNLTVIENIQIGQNLQKNKNKRIAISEILESIAISSQKNKYPNELSGGQQQRVSIARSIAKNPNILFGDEPTGAIDEEMSKQVLKLFVDINKKYKTTVVIVTHNPILAEIANRVIYVANGTIAKIVKNEHPKSVDELNWFVK